LATQTIVEQLMARSSAEFYEWLIRVRDLVRAQQDPHEELFELFVRELSEILSFDALAKFDATSSAFPLVCGSRFRKNWATN
jgi:hypothetical protein